MKATYGIRRIGLLGLGLLCLASLAASMMAFASVDDGLRRAFAVALVGHSTQPVTPAATTRSNDTVGQAAPVHMGAKAELPPIAASEADWLRRRLPEGAEPAALTGDLSKGDLLTLTLRDHVRQFEIISVRPLASDDGSWAGRLEIVARATGNTGKGHRPQLVRFTLDAETVPTPETRRVGWWARDRDTL